MSKRQSDTVEMSDDELLLRFKGGEEEDVFSAIYERYHKLLYVLAYKYLKSKELSQDAVQHVFLKFWEARSVLIIDKINRS